MPLGGLCGFFSRIALVRICKGNALSIRHLHFFRQDADLRPVLFVGRRDHGSQRTEPACPPPRVLCCPCAAWPRRSRPANRFRACFAACANRKSPHSTQPGVLHSGAALGAGRRSGPQTRGHLALGPLLVARGPGRQIVRQIPPRAARAHHVTQGVKQVIQ